MRYACAFTIISLGWSMKCNHRHYLLLVLCDAWWCVFLWRCHPHLFAKNNPLRILWINHTRPRLPFASPCTEPKRGIGWHETREREPRSQVSPSQENKKKIVQMQHTFEIPWYMVMRTLQLPGHAIARCSLNLKLNIGGKTHGRRQPIEGRTIHQATRYSQFFNNSHVHIHHQKFKTNVLKGEIWIWIKITERPQQDIFHCTDCEQHCLLACIIDATTQLNSVYNCLNSHSTQ